LAGISIAAYGAGDDIRRRSSGITSASAIEALTTAGISHGWQPVHLRHGRIISGFVVTGWLAAAKGWRRRLRPVGRRRGG